MCQSLITKIEQRTGILMPIKLKRAYAKPDSEDGTRILVERLWPRGLKKENAKIETWLKEVAPSTELRKWYSHDPTRWAQFKERYWKELDTNPGPILSLAEQCRKKTVTFVFGSKEEQLNSAAALKEYLERKFQP